MKNYGVRITEGFVGTGATTSTVDAVATSLQSEVVIDLDQAQFLLFTPAFRDSTGAFSNAPSNCNPTVHLTWEDQRSTQTLFYNQQVTGAISTGRTSFGTSNRNMETLDGVATKLGSNGSGFTPADYLTELTEVVQTDPVILARRNQPSQVISRIQGNVSGQSNGLATAAGVLQTDDGDCPYTEDYYNVSADDDDFLPCLSMNCLPCKHFNYAQFVFTASANYDTAIAYQLIF